MVSLQIADYLVVVLLLLIPLGIGVFFAIKDAKRVTRDEYLLGGRDMAMIPVMLSIFVTFTSAISLIGTPSEVYMYGPMIYGQDIGIAIAYTIAFFTVTPLLYPLRIISIFEYLQMRFESRAVRLFSTVLGMLQTFFYMAVALLAPGLALEAAAGIPIWLSVVIVGSIGTIYTAVGGMKSVVWTDAFQTIVVFIGIFAVIVKATMIVGGVSNNWNVAQEGGRTNFNKFSPDIRTRHTWYGCILVGAINWLSNLFSQSTCQRISSMKTLKSAKLAMLLNAAINLVYGLICLCMGWSMYSYFTHIECDPLEAGIVNNPNQITPFFVLHVMEDLPGFAGIFMSSLFSGSLSTLSSGINALAANTVEDLLQAPLKSLSEKAITTITKLIVLIYGAAIIILVYFVRDLKGQISQMSAMVFGCFGSSVLGMFLLGCTIPWGNKYGAISGAMTSLIINIWLIIGSKLYGRDLVSLAPASTEQCFNSSLTISNVQSLYTSNGTGITSVPYLLESTSKLSVDNSLPDTFSVYDISYEWHGIFGVVACYIVGVIVSRITRHKFENTPAPKLMIPALRKVWGINTPEVEMFHEHVGNGVTKKEKEASDVKL